MTAADNPTPPTRLRRLARHLGVTDIVAVPLAQRGRLSIQDRQVFVEINEKLDEFDQRLTTAHELAHLILEKDRLELAKAANANVRGDGSHGVIESLCDYGAKEILLPRWWAEEQLLERGLRFSSAIEIAEVARLPLEFVLTRLIELGFVRWRAIWCRQVAGKTKVVASFPLWDELFLAGVDVIPSANSPLDACWETNTRSSGKIALRVQGEVLHYSAECVKKDADTVVCALNSGAN